MSANEREIIPDRRDLPARTMSWPLIAFVLVVIAMIWGRTVYVSRQDHAATLESWERETSNLVRVLDEHTARTLIYVDEITLQIKSLREKQGEQFDLGGYFRNVSLRPGLFNGAAILDSKGHAVITTAMGFGAFDLSDRDYFALHAARDGSGLFISKPVRGRASGRPSIVATRRINMADGSFGGIAAVAVDPFYFTNFYKDVRLGKNSVVALVGLDGVVRARLSDTGSDVGQDISKGEFLERARSAKSGIYTAVAKVDGIRRLNSYRVLQDYPLIVNVSVAEEAVFADSNRRQIYYYGSAAFMTLIILLFALWLFLANRRTAKATSELLSKNASLVQQAHELSMANNELEAFSYSVSHDLRAPLRGIDGWSHALLEDYGDKLDNTARGYLDHVRAEASRMGQLIDALLDLARTLRSEIKRERVDLSALAKTVANRLQKTDPQRAVEIDIAEGISCDGDPTLLNAVMENLLGNAWKFTRQRERARIAFGAAVIDGQQVCHVRDNGIGFDEKHGEKLFRAFQRLHGKSDFEGSGIGLISAQRIILRHGGRMWAEGKPDEGATFYFTTGLLK
jgi:two-component system sensor histidine kinase BarA